MSLGCMSLVECTNFRQKEKVNVCFYIVSLDHLGYELFGGTNYIICSCKKNLFPQLRERYFSCSINSASPTKMSSFLPWRNERLYCLYSVGYLQGRKITRLWLSKVGLPLLRCPILVLHVNGSFHPPIICRLFRSHKSGGKRSPTYNNDHDFQRPADTRTSSNHKTQGLPPPEV